MKIILITLTFLITSSSFAATFGSIKSMTNKTLEAAREELIGTDFVTHSTLKKVLTLKGSGRTEQQKREKAVAQALHLVCPFFDDGVSVSLNSHDAKGSKMAADELTDNSMSSNDADYKQILRVVTSANLQMGVEVYSGSTSGNNTVGTVLGFYDLINNELAVFASTNCGSDN
jgi:hypothetical protein